MQYIAYAMNKKYQTVRIIRATEQSAHRTAASQKKRLEKRYPWMEATAVVEVESVVVATPIDWDDELLA